MTVLFKFTRYGAVCASTIVGLALTAGCADSPVRPSETNVTGSATNGQPPPVTQSTTVGFSAFDPATLTVTISTTTISSLDNTYVANGKIQLEILVDSTGKAVPCGTPYATYVRFDTFGEGGQNPAQGATSNVTELDNLATITGGKVQNVACGDQICIRAHYVPGGQGPIKVGEHKSDATPYTVECALGCTLSQGYWKNHSDWPAAVENNGLMLGTVHYTAAELESILNTPPAKGNGLISLAHQLIAAKLNVANGAPLVIVNAIAEADAMIGGLNVPPVGAGSLPSSETSALTGILDAYNNEMSPFHCGK